MPDSLLWAIALIVLFPIAGAIYQAAGTAADRRRFPPPGRLVEIRGRRLHLVERGDGPTVVLESGIAASCLNWTAVQREAAKFARVCSYDRAGLGWSDPRPGPRVLSRMVDELHALLDAAGVSAPFLLVGHSFGGMLACAYAARYPDDVTGLLLLDPLPASEWLNASGDRMRMLDRGVRLARRGALLTRLGIVRASLAMLSGGARRVPRLVAKLSSGPGESTLSRLVGEVQKMPRETWPAVRAHWCRPQSFLAMSEHLGSLPTSAAESAAISLPPPVPVTILSAANAGAAHLAERDELARRSRRGRHAIASGGHWIHLDDPEMVIQAIRELLQ